LSRAKRCTPESGRKSRDTRPRRLFSHGLDASPMRRERRGYREHERSGASHDDPLPSHRHARFHQRLSAANTEDVGQRPPRERKKELSSARRENDRGGIDRDDVALRVADHAKAIARGVDVDHTRRAADRGAAAGETADPTTSRTGAVTDVACAPDLSAEREPFVDEQRARAQLRGARGSRDARGSAADDEDFAGRASHRRSGPATTRIPGRTLTRHARRCSTPSIVTRHS